MTDAALTRGFKVQEAQPRDFFELLKPRVMRLSVFTALAGMVSAPVLPHPVIALAAILCIAAGAGASGALNMWWDAEIDRAMVRTRSRPIPSGRVERGDALAFGLVLAGFSVAMLGLFTTWLAAALLAFTIFFYVVIYSMWLKTRTAQNIVIGGVAGALPPVIGWVVATGGMDWTPWLMFALIFVWTPPHFWALALYRNDDYTRAGIPMMPVVRGDRSTRVQILGYTLVLVPLSLLPAFSKAGGPAYLVLAGVLTLPLLWGAIALVRRDLAVARTDNYRAEKRFFAYSILWMLLLFVAFMTEAVLRMLDLSPAAWPRLF
jgi:protoheme IX farnesyltransferase